MVDQRRFRLFSYIIPDDLLPNVRYLADKVEDIELVLFDLDGGPNNLPDRETVSGLVELAQSLQLSYTVHLPLDIKLGDAGGDLDISMVKAKKVIECTRAISPFAYVLHLDGRSVLNVNTPGAKKEWVKQAVRALQLLGDWTGSLQNLAVENLENYPPDFWDKVLEHAPANRCIDLGHLWVGGHDPIPFLEKHISRARVVHIHGIAGRDHQSLRYVPYDELYRVVEFVTCSGFQGVMTMEVFGEQDFHSSLKAFGKVMRKLEQEV